MSKISKPEGLSHFSISFMKRLKFSSLTFEFSRRRVIFEDFLKCQEDESVLNVTPNYLHRNRYIYESEITVPGIFCCVHLPSHSVQIP